MEGKGEGEMVGGKRNNFHLDITIISYEKIYMTVLLDAVFHSVDRSSADMRLLFLIQQILKRRSVFQIERGLIGMSIGIKHLIRHYRCRQASSITNLLCVSKQSCFLSYV